jgi:UDP-glucose 4-epimerase
VKVLIPGISTPIARLFAKHLAARGDKVVGIDRRGWSDPPAGVEVHRVDVRKRAAEDVFRKLRPDAVVHMATVSHFAEVTEERYRINLGGTQAVFEHCRTYAVPHVVFVGRHTFYGAGPGSPLYHVEEEPPLALASFPELADLVAADLHASNALWRVPDMVTTVLRFCYTLGATGHGTLAGFLRGKRVPTVAGFDPLFQFMHESDVVRALELAIDKRPRGVFNVSGPPPVPLSIVIRETGRGRIPLPEPVLAAMLGRFGLPRLARGAIEHLKYPVVIDPTAFQRATEFLHDVSEMEAMRSFAEAFPPG